MKCTQRICGSLTALGLAASALVADAQQTAPRQVQAPQSQGAQQQKEIQVVATVNGDPITRQEVEANLQPQLQGRQVNPQTAAELQNQIVEALVESRLVEHYVLEHGPDVPIQEVQETVEGLKQQLQSQQVTMDQFLDSRGYTEEMLKHRIEGSLAWQKFQQQQATDEKLQQYYQQNEQQFQAASFEQARPHVAQAYMAELWNGIVEQMKPQAEIRGTSAGQQAMPQRQGATPQTPSTPSGQ